MKSYLIFKGIAKIEKIPLNLKLFFIFPTKFSKQVYESIGKAIEGSIDETSFCS